MTAKKFPLVFDKVSLSAPLQMCIRDSCNRLAGIQFRMGKDVQPRNHCTSGGYAGCHLDDER